MADNKRLFLALVLCFLFMMAYQALFMRGDPTATPPAPTDADRVTPVEPDEGTRSATPPPAGTPGSVEASSPPDETPVVAEGSTVDEADEPREIKLGAAGGGSSAKLALTVTNLGAGISNLWLNPFYQDMIDKLVAEGRAGRLAEEGAEAHVYRLLGPQPRDGQEGEACSLATEKVVIKRDGDELPAVDLSDKSWHVEFQDAADVTMSITIRLDGQPAVKLFKKFSISADSYDVTMTQWAVGLTEQSLKIQWVNFGPMGLRSEGHGPRSDVRKILVAKHAKSDGKQEDPVTLEKPVTRSGAAEAEEDKPQMLGAATDERKLVWIALENKYFVSILYPRPESAAGGAADTARWVAGAHARVLRRQSEENNDDLTFSYMTNFEEVPPSNSTAVVKRRVVELYAGPRDKQGFDANESHAVRRYGLVTAADVAMCTSSRLTDTVTGLLKVFKIGVVFTFLNAFGLWAGALALLALLFYPNLLRPESKSRLYLDAGLMLLASFAFSLIVCGGTSNYGLSIILLVAIVRTLLHPITKKGQVTMQKQAKVMAKLKPKMDALKEKHGAGMEFNRRVLELQKEEGVSPYGPMLGCLPMLLQMPIWVAIYQGIGYSIDLRHEGFFWWIEDLSAPDGVPWLEFSQVIHLPLISSLVGPIASFNVLPFLVAGVMFLNQKFMPKTATGSDQMKQQQMMMYFMMIFMGLIFYNMPAGLNLYILTSTGVGVIESWRIRKHVAELDDAPSPASQPDTDPIKPKPKASKRKRK